MTRSGTAAQQQAEFASTPLVASTDRVYAIGDIHGRADLLVRLMQVIVRDAERFEDQRQVKLVFLGDYIDRGEDSAQVLEILTRLEALNSPNIVFLKGNHEDALISFLASPIDGGAWLDFGGLQTVYSLGIRPPRLAHGKDDLLRVRDELAIKIGRFRPLFECMEHTYQSGHVLFVHAGVDPAITLEDQSPATLLWGRGNTRVLEPIPRHRVVHGHFDEPEPFVGSGRVCIDTGAYHSGILTAIRLDGGEALLSTEDSHVSSFRG